MSAPRSARQLMLLRHAKSDWDDPQRDDRDRPLARRGIAAATAMGRRMAQDGLLPDAVLCSPARRARDTWSLVAAELERPPAAAIVENLYDFGDGSALLDVIRSRAGAAGNLLLIGHNPSLEELAKRLTGAGDASLRQRLAAKYPTAALAVIAFTGSDWSETAPGSGELKRFIRPKDLAES